MISLAVGTSSLPTAQTGSYEHILDPTQPILSITVTVMRGNLSVTES